MNQAWQIIWTTKRQNNPAIEIMMTKIQKSVVSIYMTDNLRDAVNGLRELYFAKTGIHMSFSAFMVYLITKNMEF